jgi:hypothetical protein
VERSIAGIVDLVEALETGVPAMDQDKLSDDTCEDDHDEEDKMEEVVNEDHHMHHHIGSTAMTNGCSKSFHALRVNQICKVWEATLIMALVNSTFMVMMTLLLKLSL